MARKSFILALLGGCLLTSCITNDVPYPTVVPKFKTIEVQGSKTVTIDTKLNQVVADMEEEADLRSVTVSNVSFENNPVTMSPDLNGTFDLREAMHFTLTSYQEYKWQLIAKQTIEYYFQLGGQIGESTIDDVNHRVVAKVAKGKSLHYLQVTSYKLGPKNISKYSKDLTEVHDFSQPVKVDVTVRDITNSWTIYVENSDISVEFSYVDAWSKVVWLGAKGIQGEKNGFRYRKASDKDWTAVPDEKVITDGGSFSTSVDGLEPETSYVCQAFSGEYYTEERSFTTEGIQDIPNGNLEIYSHAESDKYYSFFDETIPKWWDSGNEGATMVGGSNTICTPDTQDKAEGKASARLNSRYIVIKFAAGNLFCGEFAGLEGVSGGKVNFGRPFTLRPRKLTLMLKYLPGAVDNINGYPEGEPVKMGDADRCQVWAALGDWDYKKYGGNANSPVQVNTTDKSSFFNPKGENVIAYGDFISNKSTNDWIRIEIPLTYVSTSRKPTHIIISCAASMLGDYFTGSSSSILWVDDLHLEY